MKKMRTGIFLICILFFSIFFVFTTLTRSASGENEKVANIDDDGAVKTQTDIEEEEYAPVDKDEVKPEKEKAKDKDKAKKGGKKIEKGDSEEDILGVDEDPNEEDEINSELMGDFEKMARVSKLDKNQQIQLLQIQKARELALEKWDQKWDDKVDKAERKIEKTENKHKRVKLEKRLEKLLQSRVKLVEREFLKTLKILKPGQIIAWNTDKLWSQLEKEFADIQFTETQIEKIKGLCRKIASRVKGSKEISAQKHLQKLTKQSLRFLTKRQKLEYRKIQAEEKRSKAEARKQK